MSLTMVGYGYRFRPEAGYWEAIHSINALQERFKVMIDNNLDFEVALYPMNLSPTGKPAEYAELDTIQLIKKYWKFSRRPDPCNYIRPSLGAFPKPDAPRV